MNRESVRPLLEALVTGSKILHLDFDGFLEICSRVELCFFPSRLVLHSSEQASGERFYRHILPIPARDRQGIQ